MSETRGYFENGRWVEERESVTEGREEEEARIEDVIDETSKSVKKAIEPLRKGVHISRKKHVMQGMNSRKPLMRWQRKQERL